MNMFINDFISNLALLAPSKDKLINLGFDERGAEREIQSYIVGNREKSISVPDLGEISILFSDYNPSQIEISFICFSDIPSELSENIYSIGKVEADILALDIKTTEVFVYEHCTNGHILWYCALGGENFLKASLELARYFTKNVFLEEENLDEAEIVANRCTEIAGGPKYGDFYKMLLGL